MSTVSRKLADVLTELLPRAPSLTSIESLFKERLPKFPSLASLPLSPAVRPLNAAACALWPSPLHQRRTMHRARIRASRSNASPPPVFTHKSPGPPPGPKLRFAVVPVAQVLLSGCRVWASLLREPDEGSKSTAPKAQERPAKIKRTTQQALYQPLDPVLPVPRKSDDLSKSLRP